MPRVMLPLFPLSNVVLFPGGLVPLHVFEARYRQMTASVLAGDRTLGMIAVRPEPDPDLSGDPPLYEVGCAGFITDYQQLADGCYDVILRGTHRFRVEAEIPRGSDRLYRVAEARVLEDPAGDLARGPELRAAVLAHLRRIAERARPVEGDDPPFGRLEELDDAAFANSVSQALGLPAAEKQGLLEAADVAERLARLEGILAFHSWRTPGPGAGGSRTIH